MSVTLVVYERNRHTPLDSIPQLLEWIPEFTGRSLNGTLQYQVYNRAPFQMTVFQLQINQQMEPSLHLFISLRDVPPTEVAEIIKQLQSEIRFWKSWVGRYVVKRHTFDRGQLFYIKIKGDVSQLDRLVLHGKGDRVKFYKPGLIIPNS